MRSRLIDILVIAVAALLLVLLNEFGVLEQSAKFMFIPFIGFYFLGRWIGSRKKADKHPAKSLFGT